MKLFAITCGLFCSLALSAAIITPASLSLSDVQASVNSATDGDTIQLSAGNSVWTNALIVSNKAVVLQGAGASTVITNTQNTGSRNTGSGCVLQVWLSSNAMTRVSQISFNGNRTGSGIVVYGDETERLRIDNCFFKDIWSQAVSVNGRVYGLVDNCRFTDCYKTVDCYIGSQSPVDQMNGSWEDDLSLGTTDAVVIEDCVFLNADWYPDSTGSVSSRGQGSRTAIRFCTWTNTYNASFLPVIDVHGNQLPVVENDGDHRGSRQFEFYGNLLVMDVVGKTGNPFHLRGGTILIFSNTLAGVSMSTNVYSQEEDGPSRFDYLTNYPGYDQHWLYLWENHKGSTVVSNITFADPSDAAFILPTTNVFWSKLEGYVPLRYPHPFRDTGTTATVGTVNVGTLIIAP